MPSRCKLDSGCVGLGLKSGAHLCLFAASTDENIFSLMITEARAIMSKFEGDDWLLLLCFLLYTTSVLWVVIISGPKCIIVTPIWDDNNKLISVQQHPWSSASNY